MFIPHLDDYSKEVTDEILINRWHISDEEWDFSQDQVL